MSRFHWQGSILLVDRTIVGSVSKGASGDWFAYGCMDEWEDTPLPGSHETKQAAQDAVLYWAENHL